MFKIGEFAKLNRVTAKLLRHYDEIGLLKPESSDEWTGYRYYSAAQIPNLMQILSLRDMGFQLSEISKLIESDLTSTKMVCILENKRADILQLMDENKKRLKMVDSLINLYQQEGILMKREIMIKRVESFKVASTRAVISEYGAQGPLWEVLVRHIEDSGGKILPGCFACYHSELDEQGVDTEVFEPIASDIPESEAVTVKEMPAVDKMACIIHEGAYDTIRLSYNSILKWIEDNGYTVAGVEREIYLAGEWNTASADEYVTEIQIPVE